MNRHISNDIAQRLLVVPKNGRTLSEARRPDTLRVVTYAVAAAWLAHAKRPRPKANSFKRRYHQVACPGPAGSRIADGNRRFKGGSLNAAAGSVTVPKFRGHPLNPFVNSRPYNQAGCTISSPVYRAIALKSRSRCETGTPLSIATAAIRQSTEDLMVIPFFLPCW